MIAHRGASGYLPEHTLAAYERAAQMGADYLEPDVVSTRDGVLICRHENEISGTTDVARHPEFADRRTTKTIDGREVTGWFAEDFTLSEIRRLRAVERLPQLRPGGQAHDGRYQVPTLAEVLQLRADLSRTRELPVGVYIETKHPSYFSTMGLALEETLLRDLREGGLAGPRPGEADRPRVYLQSFERHNLPRMRQSLGCEWPAVLLTAPGASPADVSAADPAVGYDTMLTPSGLLEVARDFDGIGPDKTQVITWHDGQAQDTGLVAAAHDAGLVVHPWTFRAENHFLPEALRAGPDPARHGDLPAEVAAALRAGVDGLFTDHPDIARRVIDRGEG